MNTKSSKSKSSNKDKKKEKKNNETDKIKELNNDNLKTKSNDNFDEINKKKENETNESFESNKTNKSNKSNKTNKSNEETESNCILIFSEIIFALAIFLKIFTFILFIPNTVMIIGLEVSKTKNKGCKSEIYPKIPLFEFLPLVLEILQALHKFIEDICNFHQCKGCFSIFIKDIFPHLYNFISFIVSLFLFIYTIKNYNPSYTWENCGNIKNWLMFSLVLDYITSIIKILEFIIYIIALIILCFT